MTKPPSSGPHSDIDGVNRDGRVNTRTPDPQGNNAEDLQKADEKSKGHPDVGSVGAGSGA